MAWDLEQVAEKLDVIQVGIVFALLQTSTPIMPNCKGPGYKGDTDPT